MSGKRFLPITQADGTLITRADLYLIAQMGAPDTADKLMATQIFQAMLSTDDSRNSFNSFEKGIIKRHIHTATPLRVAAGQVMLELVRIAATTMASPSVTKALKLVAYNTHRHKNKASFETLERQARKGFSDYRDTAHLQAAALLPGTRYSDFEGCEHATMLFLGRARALEDFFDANVAGGEVKWSPWRVPTSIPTVSEIDLKRLNLKEKKLLSLL